MLNLIVGPETIHPVNDNKRNL